jgi:hypothetical protein
LLLLVLEQLQINRRRHKQGRDEAWVVGNGRAARRRYRADPEVREYLRHAERERRSRGDQGFGNLISAAFPRATEEVADEKPREAPVEGARESPQLTLTGVFPSAMTPERRRRLLAVSSRWSRCGLDVVLPVDDEFRADWWDAWTDALEAVPGLLSVRFDASALGARIGDEQ